jgi:hypothetical protein
MVVYDFGVCICIYMDEFESSVKVLFLKYNVLLAVAEGNVEEKGVLRGMTQ